jgi:hypothetical protein
MFSRSLHESVGARKARLVLAALLRIGWQIKRQSGGFHRVLSSAGWPDYVFALHDGDELGPCIMDPGQVVLEQRRKAGGKGGEPSGRI